MIINYLNAGLPALIRATAPLANGITLPFYDVDADDNVTATDALLIINLLNSGLGGPTGEGTGGDAEGEAGEPAPTIAGPPPAADAASNPMPWEIGDSRCEWQSVDPVRSATLAGPIPTAPENHLFPFLTDPNQATRINNRLARQPMTVPAIEIDSQLLDALVTAALESLPEQREQR